MANKTLMDTQCEQLAVSGVRTLTPYQPGKPISDLVRELGLTSIIKMASNENPLGPSRKVIESIGNNTTEIHRYPDGNGVSLKTALASRLQVDVDQITLGNGSNDVLEIIARTFLSPGEKAVYSQYAFAVYPLVVRAIGANGVAVPASNGSTDNQFRDDLIEMSREVNQGGKIVFFANPNNPTGTYNCHAAVETFVESVADDIIIVIDEAYYEYIDSDDYPNSLMLLKFHPNIIITRTFSKAYGLAGLRVGYSISSASIAELLNRVRQPFNVNAIALAAAESALADLDHVADSRRINQQGLKQLTKGLDHLGIDYIPSAGNFLCCHVGEDSTSVYDQLLKNGIIVRPIGNYQLPQYLRVSVGLENENARFLEVLASIINESE